MSTHLDEFLLDSGRRLATRAIGRRVVALPITESTNALARAGLMDGAESGTVYFTEYQTAGRGRMGRTWDAKAGVNLTFSIILRPPADRLTLVGIAAAIGVRSAIAPFAAPLPVTIKWPNDVYVDSKKIAGMLLENVPQASEPGVVLGIGMNVNQADFDVRTAPNATSLLLATGRSASRAEVFSRMLSEIERSVDLLYAEDPEELVVEYETHMHWRGRRVTFFKTDTSHPIAGVVDGIDPDGALRLRTNGGVKLFYAGELTSRSK